MRPISMEELKQYARELPPASRARGERHSMARHSRYAEYYSHHDYATFNDTRIDRLDFHARRGHLDGSLVWYWTHNDVIVRVDV